MREGGKYIGLFDGGSGAGANMATSSQVIHKGPSCHKR